MLNRLIFWLLVFFSPTIMMAQQYTLADTTMLVRSLSKASKPADKQLILRELTDLYRLSNPERAQVYLSQLETYVRGKKSPYWEGYVAMRKADYLHPKGLIDSAIVLYRYASERFRLADSIEQALLATCMVGSLHSREGRFEETTATLTSIDAETRTGNYPRALALLESRWAILYHYQGEFAAATRHYDAAILGYQQVRDTLQLIRTMFNKNIISKMSESSDKRLVFLERLLALCRKSDDKRTLVAVLTSLSGIYEKDQFDFEKSHEYALEAYQKAVAFGFMDVELDALVRLTNLALANDDYVLAESYIAEAEHKMDDRYEIEDQASLLHLRGDLSLDLGKYDLAKTAFQQGLDLVKDEKYGDQIIVKLMLGLGKAHYYLQEQTKALDLLQRARSMAIELQDPDGQADTDVFLAKVQLDLGNYAAAEAAALSAVGVLRSIQRQRLLADAYLLLSTARRKQGKYELALFAQDQYLILNDSLKNIDQLRSLTKKQQAFEFEREKERIAAEQAQKEALLKAEAKNSRTIAFAAGVLALLIGGFFIQSRRKNQVISTQNKQLDQLNSTKDRIFAIIGHDMRKPALAFRGMTQKINYLLQKQDYPRLTAIGNQLEETAYSLTAVTDNLLNWALLQKNIAGYQPQTVVLHQVAEELQAIFAAAAQNKNINLSIFSDTPPQQQVFADPLGLRTILRNLIDNAIKYTPEGGAVSVTATADGEWVNIGVQDSGIGIPEAEQKDLFLLRNDKSRAGTAGEKGTGLGLHLAHELAKINKGVLALNTQIAQGTSFELRLPRAAVG
jgi:signal transduction histidine kinase